MIVRFKYYYAWLFADAICNNSGLGRNGQYSDGSPRWDLISNIDVISFEVRPILFLDRGILNLFYLFILLQTSLSLRDSIESWNKGTNRWLRMVVYERAGKNKTIFTYALSALWHGFYPGYYLTFASGAFFTFASRSVSFFIHNFIIIIISLHLKCIILMNF